jgi:hypothetical protein
MHEHHAYNFATASLLVLALASANIFAETDSNSMAEYTTCAVYHRMLAGAYRHDGRSPALADIEIEKMNAFIASAKNVGKQTFGVEAVEQEFLHVWREDTQLMESQINRNYKNIARLRMNHKQRCAALQD